MKKMQVKKFLFLASEGKNPRFSWFYPKWVLAPFWFFWRSGGLKQASNRSEREFVSPASYMPLGRRLLGEGKNFDICSSKERSQERSTSRAREVFLP